MTDAGNTFVSKLGTESHTRMERGLRSAPEGVLASVPSVAGLEFCFRLPSAYALG